MWHRLSERADDTLLLASVAFMFCVVRTVAQPSTRSLRTYLSMFLVSLPVGTLAGQAALEAGFTDSGCFVATGLASLLAQDIVTAVLKNSGLIERAIQWAGDKFFK